MSKYFNVSFNEEIHCDYCSEVVHFHIDRCPICLTKNASTDRYCSIDSCIENYGGVFSCVKCGSVFKILNYDYSSDPEALIEYINKIEV